MTNNELIELVEYLTEGVRDARFHDLLAKYTNDDKVQKIVEERRNNPGERVVLG